MPSKHLLKYLKKGKLALIEHFKKQKLSQISPFFNKKQLYIKNAQSDICDINNTKDDTKDKTTQFQNKNANKTISNLENRQKSDEKLSLNKVLPKIKEKVFMQNVL